MQANNILQHLSQTFLFCLFGSFEEMYVYTMYHSVPLLLLTATEMRNITNRFRLGFGGFVDKPVAPYIATEPAA